MLGLRIESETKMGDDVRGRGRNKRMWISLEENALVDIRIEMQHSNWKCDTGHIVKKMI